MTTARETALSALQAVLVGTFGAYPDSGQFIRDPEKVPEECPDGLIIMRDGDPGPAEISLSPIQYLWTHAVPLEISATGETRKDKVDYLCKQMDAALAISRTLSGAVIDCRVMEAPIIEEIDTEGTETVRAASVSVTLVYVSASPIG